MEFINTRMVEINSNFTHKNGLGTGWTICAILKETEKAYNVVAYRFPKFVQAMWVPKACVMEAYREYNVMTNCEFKEAINYGWDNIREWS